MAFTLYTFSASLWSGKASNQASSISLASVSVVVRRLMHSTLASFQARAPRAVSASEQSAARTPGTLFAAIETPVPVQQNNTPWSAPPPATASATACATSGQVSTSPPGGPKSSTSWPRRRRSASTLSVSCDRSSLPRAKRNICYRICRVVFRCYETIIRQARSNTKEATRFRRPIAGRSRSSAYTIVLNSCGYVYKVIMCVCP